MKHSLPTTQAMCHLAHANLHNPPTQYKTKHNNFITRGITIFSTQILNALVKAMFTGYSHDIAKFALIPFATTQGNASHMYSILKR